jgi:hypothetical protein
MYGEPLTEPLTSLSENETKRYSDLEVDLLIDELTLAALEAIDQAAGEAAKAAVLSMVEREAEVMREMQRWKNEAEFNYQAIQQTKKAGIKNAVIVGLICLVSGLAVGVGGTLAITR